jgi:diguanylate cyclase (GGDEF)-like protein
MRASAGAPPPMSVLVVDDDDVDRERLLRMLQRYAAPLTVTQAGSKAEALLLLGGAKFDFVFLDFRLEDGDGRELVPEIQALTERQSLIVAITGAGDEQAAASAIKSGIHEYLPKYGLTTQRLHQALDDGQRFLGVQSKLREAERLLHRRSLYDSLTELPNRNLFFDRLEQACLAHARNRTPFAVMMIDLDRFKEVNDTLGHQAGDAVLRETGARLAQALRASDTVARLGGDEFAVLLPEAGSEADAERVSRKIAEALRRPVLVQEQPLSVGASIGVALCPAHGDHSAALLSNADTAMYQAKRGHEKIVIFGGAEKPHSPALPAQALIVELEQAIAGNELVMHYQPKIRLDTREVVGFEALVRWRHHARGLVGPNAFIPTVESSPLLTAFTHKTIDLALGEYAGWRAWRDDFKLAINVSARMLDDKNFVPLFLSRLSHYGIPRGKISLELTETALLINLGKARDVVRQLADSGVSISIDDFGAGFTSFSYLRDFAAPEIKLDCSFVAGLEANSFNSSLVRSLAVLCNALGVDFIAEGVEELETWPMLVGLGCTLGQGYSIARPMPGAEVLSWLANWSAAQGAAQAATMALH